MSHNNSSLKKKLYVHSYGCQMNVYDGFKMQDLLLPFGYEPCNDYEDADMVILNTCHIREKASEKVYSELGRIRPFKEVKKKNGDNMIIVVAGCTAQAEGEEIFKRAPMVDIVVGPQSYHNLPKLIDRINDNEKRVFDLEFSYEEKFDKLPEERIAQGAAAFITIQEGCDKFCKFCVVPYTRGAEVSRPVEQIYRESIALAARGAQEIHLLGQNVNAYHGTDPDGKEISLAKLINHLATIDGVKRIRYTTSHPRDMTDELIAIHGSEEKLMPFLHLPIQSGSNAILKAMNRKHTREFYLDIISKLKAARPDLALSSDFIVGYPGETDQDFEDTMDIVRQVGYTQCYSFKYSPRPGTPAAEIEDQVPETVKTERLYKLQNLINELQESYNRSFIGKEIDVLFDRQGKFEGQIIGKSPYMHSVYVEGPEYLGKIAKVKVTESFANSLSGYVIKE